MRIIEINENNIILLDKYTYSTRTIIDIPKDAHIQVIEHEYHAF